MSNYIITSNPEIRISKAYKDVSKIIYKLMESGVVFSGKGYCISMSDIVYTLLTQNGIPAKIVECQLSITNRLTDDIYVVGFTGLKDNPTRTDNHVVVVTTTEPSILIDVSIAHLLPNGMQGVIDKTNKGNYGIFANVTTNEVSLTYQEKKSDSIAVFHQRSIVDRINTDITIFKNLNILKYAVITALIISTLNALRGAYDYYQVYVDQTNFWGPKTVGEMYHKLTDIQHQIEEIKKEKNKNL